MGVSGCNWCLLPQCERPRHARGWHAPSHCNWWQSHPQWSDRRSFSRRFLICRHTRSRPTEQDGVLTSETSAHRGSWHQVTLCTEQPCASLGQWFSNKKEAPLTCGNKVTLTPHWGKEPAMGHWDPQTLRKADLWGGRQLGFWGQGSAEDRKKGAQPPFWGDTLAELTEVYTSLPCILHLNERI